MDIIDDLKDQLECLRRLQKFLVFNLEASNILNRMLLGKTTLSEDEKHIELKKIESVEKILAVFDNKNLRDDLL